MKMSSSAFLSRNNVTKTKRWLCVSCYHWAIATYSSKSGGSWTCNTHTNATSVIMAAMIVTRVLPQHTSRDHNPAIPGDSGGPSSMALRQHPARLQRQIICCLRRASAAQRGALPHLGHLANAKAANRDGII